MATTDQPNRPTTDTKRPGIPWFIWTILVLPFIYVLSIGPVAGYYERTAKRAPRALVAFYRPLAALARAVPQFDRLIQWYVDLWVPNPLPPLATTPRATPPTSNTATS